MKPIRKRPARKPSKKPAAKAPAYPIDATWRAEVRKILEERGLSQSWLANEIGAVPSAIVFLFNTATSSALVPAIHKALGLVPPTLPPATQAIRAA